MRIILKYKGFETLRREGFEIRRRKGTKDFYKTNLIINEKRFQPFEHIEPLEPF